MNQLLEKSCFVCSSPHLEVFFQLPKMPVFSNLLWKDRQEAQNCPKGDINLAFCQNCGFIENVAFDPAKLEYTEAYECSLDFSPRFQDYAQSLATQLIKQHDLQHKTIIEIGCGKGDFLLLLCELGKNSGIGFDPTYVHRPEHEKFNHQVEFIQDYYSEHYANYQGDLIVCRHTLEHIQNPTTLLKTLRRTIDNHIETKIFFEVPNTSDIIGNLAIWDIIYEHCCYFSPTSLSYAFKSCGFRVDKIIDQYRGQFLSLEASPDKISTEIGQYQTEKVQQLKSDVANFQTNFSQKIIFWKKQLEKIANKNRRIVLWGAGSKGVSFLNIINDQKQIEYVVDINPNKQGKYIAGTGQKIVAPEFLLDYQPDTIIVMNPIYESEIRKMLENMNFVPEFITSV